MPRTVPARPPSIITMHTMPPLWHYPGRFSCGNHSPASKSRSDESLQCARFRLPSPPALKGPFPSANIMCILSISRKPSPIDSTVLGQAEKNDE